MGFWKWLFGTSPQSTASVSAQNLKRSRAANQVVWRSGSYPMEVVGESNYQSVLLDICGRYNREGHNLEIEAEISREPTNPYDANAVVVQLGGRKVGYLGKEQAQRVSAQMMDEGIDCARCQSKVVGGWRTNQHDQGYFGVKLGIPNRGWIDFGLNKQPPTSSGRRVPSKSRRPAPAPAGPLVGQWIFIWGAPADGEVAKELAALGAHVMAGIGKSTTLVIQVDDELTPGMRSSATYLKVQARIEESANLRIFTLKELREQFAS